MKSIEKEEHVCAVQTELDKTMWVCDTKDLINDIKYFMREYYVGFYSEDGERLVIKFNNGQKFMVSVSEIK